MRGPIAANHSSPSTWTRRSPSARSGCAQSSTSTARTPFAFYVSGQMSHRGAVPGQQAGQGLHPHQPDRVQLAAVHGQRGQRLQAVPRRGRTARLLPGLRPRRRVLRDRRQHGRLPPDPVPADDGPGEGGRQADRRRPAAHRHRRQGRPVPADHARAPISRCSTACCTCSSRTGTSTPISSPSTPRAGRRCPSFLADYPPDTVADDHRHPRGRHPHGGAMDRRGRRTG